MTLLNESIRVQKELKERLSRFEWTSMNKGERTELEQQIVFNKKKLGEYILNFAKIKAIMYFAKFVNAFVKPRNLNFSRNKLYIWNLQITCFKMIYNMFII